MTAAPTSASMTAWPLRNPVAGGVIALGVGILGGLLTTDYAFLVVATIAAAALTVAVFVRPVLAPYAYLALAPLTVGINRGAVIPVLRPSEALLFLLAFALVIRKIARIGLGERLRIHPTRLDVALVAVVFLGAVVPVAWMAGRGFRPSTDDVFSAMVFVKYLVLYLVVRGTVTTREQVATCLKVILGANAIVAVVAILQALRLFGVDQLMAAFYAPLEIPRFALNNRGSSTLSHAIAVGDVMAVSLAIVLAALTHRLWRRSRLVVLAILFTLGAVASGQFSGLIAVIVAAVAAGAVLGRLRSVAAATLPAIVISGLLLSPVLAARFASIASDTGLPVSWTGRLDNLETRVWPRLFADHNYVLGVRPSPRIPAWESWRDWVFIESGHTWLLWVGGIPLLIAFLALCWTAARATARVARQRTDAIGVAAVGAFAATVVIFVLTTLDAHLTLRGTADLYFPLLALALTAGGTVAARERRPAAARQGGAT